MGNIEGFVEKINNLQRKREELKEQIAALEGKMPFIAACDRLVHKKGEKIDEKKGNGLICKRVDIRHIDNLRQTLIDLSKKELEKTEVELSKYVRDEPTS